MPRFQSTYTFDQRCCISKRIREKHPGHVPVIVERMDHSRLPELKHKKFLVPVNTNIARFISEIRRQLEISSAEGIFLFIRNRIVPTSMMMDEIDHQYADADGFVYVDYSGENVFG